MQKLTVFFFDFHLFYKRSEGVCSLLLSQLIPTSRPVPSPRPLTLPYADTFTEYQLGAIPRLLSDMQGCFEIAPASGGRAGVCLRQTALGSPVFWIARGAPFTVVGSPQWDDYSVSGDVLQEVPGWAELLGRASNSGQGAFSAYHLRLEASGTWALLYMDDKVSETLASGMASCRVGTWHTLALKFDGSQITASIDGKVVADRVRSDRTATGMGGFQVSGWHPPKFANLRVPPLPNGPVAYAAVATASTFQLISIVQIVRLFFRRLLRRRDHLLSRAPKLPFRLKAELTRFCRIADDMRGEEHQQLGFVVVGGR